MYLRRLTLQNVKSFHGERRVELDFTRPDGSYAGWTVIAGRNNSGKSTLLRAIALTICGPDAARSLVPGFEDWISAGDAHAKATATLEYDPEVEELAPHQLALAQAPFQAGLTWTWRVERDAAGRVSPLPGHQPQFSAARNSRELLEVSGPWQQGAAGWFCAGYGPFRRLAGGSTEVQRLMGTAGPVSRLTSLFHEDASLAEGVGWLIAQHLRALEERQGARTLKDAALAILGDGLLPDGYRIDTVDSEGLWVVHDEHRFPLREMSDGYRSVAALVVDLVKQLHDAYGKLTLDTSSGHPALSYPGVVLIDEVDAHLHVTWQRRIGGWLKAHFPAIQFIVTTHSPYICQAADPGGLIRLPAPDEYRSAEVVSQDLYQRVVYGSGDDAVLSDLFGLESPYSEQAQEARDELMALEMDVLKGTASDAERRRYREIKQQLTSSPAARAQEIAALFHPHEPLS
jgi:hypothetical protein